MESRAAHTHQKNTQSPPPRESSALTAWQRSNKMVGILFPHERFCSVIRHKTDTTSAEITFYISRPIIARAHRQK